MERRVRYSKFWGKKVHTFDNASEIELPVRGASFTEIVSVLKQAGSWRKKKDVNRVGGIGTTRPGVQLVLRNLSMKYNESRKLGKRTSFHNDIGGAWGQRYQVIGVLRLHSRF